MDSLSNDQIQSETLAKVELLELESLDPKIVVVRYISNSVFFLFLLISMVTFALSFVRQHFTSFLFLLGLGVLFWISSMFFVKKRYEKEGYAIREKDIFHKKGYLWTTQTLIPFNRIQHCSVQQGPFERMYGLGSLKLYTAGGNSSDLVIQGLSIEVAENLKDFISSKISSIQIEG